MSTVDIDIEVMSFGQTNGKTYHARFNCGNQDEKEPSSADSVRKMAEALLLLPAIISLSSEERAKLMDLAHIKPDTAMPSAPAQPAPHSPPAGRREACHGNNT